MPRKVTLPCRSLSCSRSDLSCCVSLCLKQYHPTYLPLRISAFHTWKRLSLFSTFAAPFSFVSIIHHDILISIVNVSSNNSEMCTDNFKNRTEKNFFLSNGKRFRHDTLLRLSYGEREESILAGRNGGEVSLLGGDRINRNNFSNRQQFNRDRQQWRVQ